jgi:hypothetical protein
MQTKTVNLRDLPEILVRQAKAAAALRGISLKEFVIQAIQQSLVSHGGVSVYFTQPRKGVSKAKLRQYLQATDGTNLTREVANTTCLTQCWSSPPKS